MIIIFKKILLLLLIFLMIFSLDLQRIYATDHTEMGGNEDTEYIEGSNVQEKYEETGDAEDEILLDATPTSDPDSEFTNDELSRVEFNNTDKRILDNFLLLNKAMPELEGDIEELSRLSSISVDELSRVMQKDGYQAYKKIALETQEKYFTKEYLKERVLSQPKMVMELLDLSSETQAIFEIHNNRLSVETAIDDAINTQIDTRVIEALSYLVRPKDDPRGGAGHHKIKVARLFKNYTRESTNKSRESESVILNNKQLEEDKQKDDEELAESNATTIEKIKSDDTISEIGQTAEATGLANSGALLAGEVVDSSGNTVSDFMINSKDDYRNISAHYKGMAVSISDIDEIKCTKIEKKRIGSDKKTAQPPQSIKVLWQTTDGYSQDKSTSNSSYDDMILNMGQDALLDMLSGLNIDFAEVSEMDGASLSDISSLIGQAFFAQALNSPGNDIWKFDLTTTLQKIGAVILADNIGLDRQPFLDASLLSVDSVAEALGRHNIEQRLSLPYGALKGANREEMLTNIGRSRVQKELGLPADTLQGYNGATQNELMQRIGARVFEEELGLKKDSLYRATNYSQFSDANGGYRVDAMFDFHKSLDERLSLAQGSSKSFRFGQISALEYAKRVAIGHILERAYKYHNYLPASDPSESVSATNLSDVDLINWRDEMFNLPHSTIDRFLDAQINDLDYKNIGIFALSRALENSDSGRTNLSYWLANPNQSYTVPAAFATVNSAPATSDVSLPLDTYASTFGVTNKELFFIIGNATTGQSAAVFKRLGEKIFTTALLTSSTVQQIKDDFIENHPELQEGIEQYEFYHQRYSTIKNNLPDLKRRGEDLKNAVEKIDLSLMSREQKDAFNAIIKNLEGVLESSPERGDIEQYLEISREIIEGTNSAEYSVTSITNQVQFGVSGTISDLQNKINAYNYQLEIIAKCAYEILTGQIQNNFRIEDISTTNLRGVSIELGGVSISGLDMALFLSGKIDFKNILLTIGSAKMASELNLPPKALKYASKLIEKVFGNKGDAKTSFYRAIGYSVVEANLGSSQSLVSSQNNMEELADTSNIVEFRDKLAQKMKINKNQANTIVAESLGLKGYNLEYLMRGDFGAWSSARDKAQANDRYLNVPIGTTENFVQGKSFKDAMNVLVSDDDYRQMATKLGVSETSLRTFIALANGESNPAINEIYYVDRNVYLETQDTADVCTGKAIPDDVFMYYDSDGMHYFNSYPEANEYVKANQNKKIDYVQDIVRGLSNVTAKDPTPYALNDTQKQRIADSIKSFVEGGSNYVLAGPNIPDSSYYGVDQVGLNLKGNISTDLYLKFFTRGMLTDQQKSPGIDFFKVVGVNFISKFGASYVGQELGINIGSSRLTADDIYEVFNGNSQEIFANIGGSILDSELGLERGTFESILLAGNSNSRKCALERASTQILGDLIGVNGLTLDGSLFNNMGGSKIEQLLGLPQGSFRGKDVSELIDSNRRNHVPLIDFINAFNLPITKDMEEEADAALKSIGKEYYNRYAKEDFYTKAKVINNYVEAAGAERFVSASLPLWLDTNITGMIYLDHINYFIGLLKNKGQNNVALGLELKKAPGFSQMSSEEIIESLNAFKSRLSSIDSSLGLLQGETFNLLTDIISPDNYRKKVGDTALSNIGYDTFKKVFGIETEITLDDLNRFKSAIDGSLTYSGGFLSVPASPAQRLTEIYSFLNKAFSLKFDEKAGFEKGTFASIIADPTQAKAILTKQAAKKIDQQLGIEEKSVNFSTFLDIYQDNNPESTATFCAQTDRVSQCLNEKSYRSSVVAKTAIKNTIATEISGILSDLSSVTVQVQVNSPMRGTRLEDQQHYGITINEDQIKDIFRGDFRVLGVIATIKSLGSVLGDENGRSALGGDINGFLFNPQDVVWAFYGDPETEAYASNRARQEVYARFNQASQASNSASDTSAEDDITGPNISLISSATVFDNPVATSTNSRDATIAYADLNYPVATGANVNPPAQPVAPVEPNPNNYATDYEYSEAQKRYTEAVTNYNSADLEYFAVMNEADQAASAAATVDRKLKKEILEYRVADCMLRKLDKNIPAGFSWAMMKGNGFVRTTLLLNYVENWMRKDQDWMQFLPQGSLNSIFQYFSGPYKGDIDRLVNNTTGNILNMVDEYLINHSPNIFGVTFAPGTAQGLFAFIKNGNIKDPVKIAGTDYSLSSIYKNYSKDFIGGKIGGWVDKKFGLPQGTSYSLYTAYKSFKAAKDAYSVVQFAMLNQIRTVQSSVTIGSTLSDTAAQLSKYEAGTKVTLDNYQAINQNIESGVKANANAAKSQARGKMTEFKAAIVTIIITTLFSDQIASAEEALGLVPGTGSILVGMIIGHFMGAAFNPYVAIMFIVLNLFGVYKVEMLCTADGYYPVKESPTDPSKWDNGNLGVFDAFNEKVRQKRYIEAAQYKTDRLVMDLYEMPYRTGDKNLVPLQVMVGRDETIGPVKPLVMSTACAKFGIKKFIMGENGLETAICSGTKVGIWKNAQYADKVYFAF